MSRSGILAKASEITLHASSRIVAGACALALFCGCDAVKGSFQSADERINEARPVSTAVTDSREMLNAALEKAPQLKETVDRDYAAKLKVRAIACSHGYSPGRFASIASIRTHLPNTTCFAYADQQLLEWFTLQRLRIVLSMPALGDVASELPPIFAASNPISSLRFAAAAPVAISTSDDTLELLDLGSGKPLFSDSALAYPPSFATLSSNGRVFAISSRDGGLQLRDSVTGQPLAALGDIDQLFWLDPLAALVHTRRGTQIELIDFTSGKRVPCEDLRGALHVVPSPEEPSTFIAIGAESILKFKLERATDGPKVTVLEELPSTHPWSDSTNALTSDGKALVQVSSQGLAIVDLTTLHIEAVDIGEITPQTVMPLPDADTVLLSLSTSASGSSPPKQVIYSIAERTFSPVEDEHLQGSDGSAAERIVYVPTFNSLAIVDGSTLRTLSRVKHGLSYSAQMFAEQLDEDRRREQAAAAQAKALASESMSTADSAIRGAIADLAKNAQIEAVGVHESKNAPRGADGPTSSGVVAVFLRHSSQDIVLVLSSSEPVDWNITGDPQQLKAVLLSGNSSSTVIGANAIRVTRIGDMSAYERGSSDFTELQQAVKRWAGKPIDTFQGTHSGTTFLVGGK